jgi:hypothetical protein
MAGTFRLPNRGGTLEEVVRGAVDNGRPQDADDLKRTNLWKSVTCNLLI